MTTLRFNMDLPYGSSLDFLESFSQLFLFNRCWPLKAKVTQDDLGRLFITISFAEGERWKPPKVLDLSNIPDEYKDCPVYAAGVNKQ